MQEKWMGELILTIGHEIAVVRRHPNTELSVRSKPCDEIKLERLLGQSPNVIPDPATGGLDYLTIIYGGGGVHRTASGRGGREDPARAPERSRPPPTQAALVCPVSARHRSPEAVLGLKIARHRPRGTSQNVDPSTATDRKHADHVADTRATVCC